MTVEGTRTREIKATIANGASTSNAVKVSPGLVVGVRFPAALTGSNISFTTCQDEGGTFSAVYLTSAAYSIAKTNSVTKIFDETASKALGDWVKVVSDGTEGAERSIVLIVRDLS